MRQKMNKDITIKALIVAGLVGLCLSAASFEKIALIDSLDEALKWDVETPEGTLKDRKSVV